MRRSAHILRSAAFLAATFFLATCSNDQMIGTDRISGPMAAIGVDPVTGATIETNQDDYSPGEIVHVVGHGWAPNETVGLFMTEAPDTHDDVSAEVQADAAGTFSIHFYDVQQHDLGVTFTLTATGHSSGSSATAVFTDNQNPTLSQVQVFEVDCTTAHTPALNEAVCAKTTVTNQGGSTPADFWFQWVRPNNTVARFINSTGAATGLTVTDNLPAADVTFSGTWTVRTCKGNAPNVGITPCTAGNLTTGSQPTSFTIPVANIAPIVSAGGDATVNEGSLFSQPGSFTDPDANTWTATVDYGDGTSGSLPLVAKTFSLNHTYTDNGAYTVTVTINDGTTTGTDQVLVTVDNVDPVVSAGADANLAGGGTFTRTGSFTDPGADTWTATVDYDDGAGPVALPLNPDKTFDLSHTYAASGTYTVKVTVTDDDGGVGTDEVQVTVDNTAPIVSAGADDTIDEGDTFSGSGSFTDPDADSWTATVDYGDGGGDQPLTLAGKNFTLSHLYDDDTGGPFTVTVTVTDSEGASHSDQLIVTVNNVKPTVDAGAGATINEGSAFSGSGSFTDPGADTWTATVDYGDGAGPVALALSGKTFNLSHVYADNGTYTVTVTVTDDDTGTGSDNLTVTVNNVPPDVNAGADATINEGSAFNQNGSFTDPGADTWTATVNYGDGTGTNPLSLSGKNFTLNHTYADNGSYTVTVTVTDDDGGSDTDQVTVTVNNVDPVVSAGADASINEGGAINQNGSFTDPGADTWTATVDYGDGSGTSPLALSGKNFTLNHTYTDNGNYTVTVTVTDDDGGSGTDQLTVNVANVPPSITLLTVPLNPIAAGTPVHVSWTFEDPGADTWTCYISWDIGMTEEAGVASTGKTCNVSKILAAGIYTVTVRVNDDDGGTDSETAVTYIVVYDPSAGFVTGGGWINSPPGACKFAACTYDTIGKANFGFVSKYQKGATTPSGNTEFQFHAGDLNFKSNSYEWLVVAGNNKAQYKGKGTINGSGEYGFLITALDGSPDKFRIKIWQWGTSTVVYDNQMGQLEDSNYATAIGGGSIVIHAK